MKNQPQPQSQLQSQPPSITQRDIDLVRITMSLQIDSDDLDAACADAGLDPQTADLSDIRNAGRNKFGAGSWRWW